jgi:hypothetical protein
MKKTGLLALLCIGIAAEAGLLTSTPAGGSTTVLTSVTGDFEIEPSAVIQGFTVTGSSHIWYGDSGYGLSDNGSWGDFAWVGGECFTLGCTATIDLGGLYSAVGGFMNYAPGFGGTPTIAALAADGTTVLESYDLSADAPISTPGGVNDGAFRGISRASADIAYFRISGGYLIMHDLTLVADPTAVPEPSTMALAGIAIAGLFGWRVRRG